MDPLVIDGKYQVVRELGKGGMGAVYEARHLGTGRRVAVKVVIAEMLAGNTDAVARFQREAKATGSIETQHIAHVLDTGRDGPAGHPYLVMEFLSGEDVEHLIERVGVLSPDLTLRIAAQACIGLQAAHEAGVVHRDMKPANLFLTRREGGERIVKVLDFGIAKVTMDALASADGQGLTKTSSMLGTPLYMSPEQALGAKNTDPRTDIWSLGIVLYQLLTRVTPHADAETLGSLILSICSRPARPVQEVARWVPPEVAWIVDKAIMIDANARFQSAAEMLEAIRRLLPNGFSIREEMLGQVVPAVQSVPSSRVPVFGARPPADARPSLPPSAQVSQSAFAAPSPARTPAAATRATESTGGRGSVLLLALGGVALLAGASFVGYRAVGHSSGTGVVATDMLASASAVPAGSANVVGTPAAVTTPALLTVQLAVSPPNASVTVDGNSVVPVNGGVAITGAPGTAHRVHLSSGKRELSSDVVIAETGAVPARMDLPRTEAISKAPVSPVVTPVPAAPPPTAAPAPSHVPQPTSKPATPGPDREFK